MESHEFGKIVQSEQTQQKLVRWLDFRSEDRLHLKIGKDKSRTRCPSPWDLGQQYLYLFDDPGNDINKQVYHINPPD